MMPNNRESFRELVKRLWKTIWGKVVVFGAGIAVIAGIITSSIIIKNVLFPTSRGLKIVNYTFKEEALNPHLYGDQFDTLDLMFRNTSDEVHVLKEVQLVIKKEWQLFPAALGGYQVLRPADTLTFVIDHYDLKSLPYIYKINLSLQIKPANGERLLVSIKPLSPDYNFTEVYLCDLKIVYDERNSVLAVRDILVCSGAAIHDFINKYNYDELNKRFSGMALEDTCKISMEAISEIRATRGTMCPLLDTLIKHIDKQ